MTTPALAATGPRATIPRTLSSSTMSLCATVQGARELQLLPSLHGSEGKRSALIPSEVCYMNEGCQPATKPFLLLMCLHYEVLLIVLCKHGQHGVKSLDCTREGDI